MPCYEVRFFNKRNRLRKAFRSSVFMCDGLYCIGTISFSYKEVIFEFPEASTALETARRKAYSRAKDYAERMALIHRIEEIDDATVFGVKKNR